MEAAKSFGCTHGICPDSSEWKTHFCPEGKHCIDDDAVIKYDDKEHWAECGKGCDVRLNADVHIFGTGEITKEATKDTEGIMSVSCTECDYIKEEIIPKLTGSHTHEYAAVVTSPTCTSGGYTTHTCSCGHSWTDTQTKAADHAYAYQSSAEEHWKECSVCHAVTERKSHKLSEWTTVKKAGYTFPGEKQRVCRTCGFTLTETIPMLPVPENKFVLTIPDYDVDRKSVV